MTDRIDAPYPCQVFYDGDCSVCRHEMDRYRRLPHGGRLEFIDIAAAGFRPEHWGRSRQEFMARMHLRDANGRWYRGVDAFPPLWRALPGRRWQLLARLVEAPLLHPLAVAGYRLFARYRHWLPRRSRCADDRCERHRRG